MVRDFQGILNTLGVSLNGGTTKTPQTDHFLVGKAMVVGYHHFRKPPYVVLSFKNRRKPCMLVPPTSHS